MMISDSKPQALVLLVLLPVQPYQTMKGVAVHFSLEVLKLFFISMIHCQCLMGEMDYHFLCEKDDGIEQIMAI